MESLEPAARRDRARAVDAPASRRLAATTVEVARQRLPPSCCFLRRRWEPPAQETPPCGRSPPPWRSRSPCAPGPPQLLPPPVKQTLEARRGEASSTSTPVHHHTHLSNTALIKQVLRRSKREATRLQARGECQGVRVNYLICAGEPPGARS